MIYTITDGKLTAKIDSLGAQQISLTDETGLEYIWQRKAPHWKDCAVVIFPIVGRCKDGIITVDGKEYSMPECHGFAPLMEYDVAEQTESSITFVLTDNGYTRTKYPFAFRFLVKYAFENGTLVTTLTTENPGNSDLIFGVGGHPGYRCPLLPGEDYTDYEVDFGKKLTLETQDIEGDFFISADKRIRVLTDEQILPLDKKLFANDALLFENPEFDAITYRGKKSGKGLHFAFENFKAFAMWSDDTSPSSDSFVCFEPWNSMGKRAGEGTELAKKKDIVTLAPGKSFTCSYRVTLL